MQVRGLGPKSEPEKGPHPNPLPASGEKERAEIDALLQTTKYPSWIACT